MDYKKHSDLENWFLSKPPESFPNKEDFVSLYKTLKTKLKQVQKQVTQGANATDGTSLTWHDQSHIDMVATQASHLLSYKEATISPFETFILLVAIQIHDVMNSDGRDEHENRATDIFSILNIGGIIDSVIKRAISDVVASHSGSFTRGTEKERDKISYLLPSIYPLKGEKIKMRFLAAILRLADEYADNENRALSYLLQLGKIEKLSEIHQKYAHCLHSVTIEKNTGIIEFDFHVQLPDAQMMFEKFDKEKQTVENVYLIDEIFCRTIKSHYETIYCMRFMRPYINIDKLSIMIEIEVSDITKKLRATYELVEKGYPNTYQNIYDLCQDQLKLNGGLWSGLYIKEYIEKHNLN